MSKAILVKQLVKNTGLSETEASTQVENVVNAIKAATAKDNDKIILRGFGTFVRKYRDGRTGRNPATGEPITIAGRSALTFKAAKD